MFILKLFETLVYLCLSPHGSVCVAEWRQYVLSVSASISIYQCTYCQVPVPL